MCVFVFLVSPLKVSSSKSSVPSTGGDVELVSLVAMNDGSSVRFASLCSLKLQKKSRKNVFRWVQLGQIAGLNMHNSLL